MKSKLKVAFLREDEWGLTGLMTIVPEQMLGVESRKIAVESLNPG